jgi:large subunit ribosomal protein L22
MNVTARTAYLRTSPRKVRLLLPELRGMAAEEALSRLKLAPQAAARPVAKTIRSALANAEHNYSLDPKTLVIETAKADGGPSLKRFKPASKGMAHPFRRPTTHLTIVLRDVTPAGETKPKRKLARKPKAQPKAATTTKPKAEQKPTSKIPQGPRGKTAADAGATQTPQQPGSLQAAPRRTARQTGRGGGKAS